MPITSAPKFTLSIAAESDRQEIYKIRHHVYAKELQQHKVNPSCELRDELDSVNQYIVAKQEQIVVGFVSITPPTSSKYSVVNILLVPQSPMILMIIYMKYVY